MTKFIVLCAVVSALMVLSGWLYFRLVDQKKITRSWEDGYNTLSGFLDQERHKLDKLRTSAAATEFELVGVRDELSQEKSARERYRDALLSSLRRSVKFRKSLEERDKQRVNTSLELAKHRREIEVLKRRLVDAERELRDVSKENDMRHGLNQWYALRVAEALTNVARLSYQLDPVSFTTVMPARWDDDIEYLVMMADDTCYQVSHAGAWKKFSKGCSTVLEELRTTDRWVIIQRYEEGKACLDSKPKSNRSRNPRRKSK